MARQAGEVLERRWKRGRGYALRFHAYLNRLTIASYPRLPGWRLGQARTVYACKADTLRRELLVIARRRKVPEIPAKRHLFADLLAGVQECVRTKRPQNDAFVSQTS